jgi:LytS/YehU family sensor histidine kinase
LILNNSREAFIPLEQELEALELYLELESLRFEQRFNYRITVEPGVDTSVIKVPPLIIQPYVENAIWHGLMPKKEEGNLDITLYQEEEILFCNIRDDGVGRKKSAEYKSKSSSGNKSMGMRITADRIAMLQNQDLGNSYITINDIVLPDGSPGGTEVLIAIPFRF